MLVTQAENHLVFLVGPSKSGKDTLAKLYYPNYYKLSCNSAFKHKFSVESAVSVAVLNDQTQRHKILEFGPYKGKTISDGMVQAYKESQSRTGHGQIYTDLTLTGTLKDLLSAVEWDRNIVVTDCRKISELLLLLAGAQQFSYQTTFYSITAPRQEIKDSDLKIAELKNMYRKVTGFKPLAFCNNY